MPRSTNKRQQRLSAVSPSDNAVLQHRRLRGRVAQRRLRFRRENEKAHLEKQNSLLESALNNIISAFVEFHKSAFSPSMPPMHTKLALELRHLTIKLIDYSKTVENSGSCNEGLGILNDSPNTSEHATSSGTSNAVLTNHNTLLINHDNVTHSKATSTEHPPGKFDEIQSPRIKDSHLDPNFESDSSFAQYLESVVCDYAFRCMSSLETGAYELLRIFKLSFAYYTTDQILTRLRRQAPSSINDTLYPLRHLGGGGLHISKENDAMYLTQTLLTSEAPEALYQNAGARGIAPDMIGDLSDFYGEWLYATDVEQYLRQKGICLSGNSTSVVVSLSQLVDSGSMPSVPIESLQDRVQDITASSYILQSEQYTEYPTLSGGFANDSLSGIIDPEQSSNGLCQAPRYDQEWEFSGFSCDDFSFDSINHVPTSRSLVSNVHHYSSLPSLNTQEENRQVLLDIRTVIQVLKNSAVCLVDGPGFRKYDVDSALRAAIVEFINLD